MVSNNEVDQSENGDKNDQHKKVELLGRVRFVLLFIVCVWHDNSYYINVLAGCQSQKSS